MSLLKKIMSHLFCICCRYKSQLTIYQLFRDAFLSFWVEPPRRLQRLECLACSQHTASCESRTCNHSITAYVYHSNTAYAIANGVEIGQAAHHFTG